MKSCEKYECHCGEKSEIPAHKVLLQYIRVMKLHRGILEQRLNKTGVYRSQHQILVFLLDHSDASQKEIAEWLSVSTATIAVSVKKLEKGGYITRIVDQADNRVNKIRLTEKGVDMVEHSRQFFHNIEAQMFCDFSLEEFAVMEALLNRVYENLSRIIPDETTERED